MHVAGAVQVWHEAPARPHAPSWSPAWHAPVESQHPEQVAGSHTQRLPWHFVPAPHAAVEPHAHAPFTHESAVVGEHVVQLPPLDPHVPREFDVQAVPEQQPVGQLAASHTQRPPAQR